MHAVEKSEKITKNVIYGELLTCKFVEFNGEVDPLIAMLWISAMEEMFEPSLHNPIDWVMIAASQLGQRGEEWWGLIYEEIRLEGMRFMMWEAIKEIDFEAV